MPPNSLVTEEMKMEEMKIRGFMGDGGGLLCHAVSMGKDADGKEKGTGRAFHWSVGFRLPRVRGFSPARKDTAD